MECSFCKKVYSTTSSLYNHQRTTRSCINKQKEQGLLISPKFNCMYCKKICSSKIRMNEHLLSCTDKYVETTKILVKEEMNENIEKLKEENKLLKRENQILKRENQLLKQEKLNQKESMIKKDEPNIIIQDIKEAELKQIKIKKVRIPKAIKTMVWNLYIGSSIAESTCICCKQERITNREFQCGHVIAEAKGGTQQLSNLRPICAHCNTSMGTQDMNEFIKQYFGREL